MLPVLSVLSFVCLAAAGPHYNYDPPKGGAVAIHGIPFPVGASPLAPFLAISHDAQRAVRPSLPLYPGIVPFAQPLPSHFAIRDVQVPIKQAEGTKPQSLITSPFSSVFVPHLPFFPIRDVQVPRVPVTEEEIEELDESDEVEDVPQALPVAQGMLPPWLAVQHDAQTPIRVDGDFSQNIFGFHTDLIFGPPLVSGASIRPALTITNDLPVPGNKPAAPSFIAIRNQQIPIRGPLVAVTEDQKELEDVELVGADDTRSTSQESVMQGLQYVEVAYHPVKIANIFDTREANPDNEVHAPAGIVQSTQPIFFLQPFVNSKAHESIRTFSNSKAHPDTHEGPNEESVATLLH